MRIKWHRTKSINLESVLKIYVNQAYDSFLIFMDIFNKHCPVTKDPQKRLEKKPWFTKGLKRACTKKNKLYNAFIVMRSAEAEQKVQNIHK